MSGRAARASRRDKLRAQFPRQFPAILPQVRVRSVRPIYPAINYHIDNAPIRYAQVEPRAYQRAIRIFESLCRTNLWNRREVMNVPVVYEDETENEFDIELCCAECATQAYGWSAAQFTRILESVNKGFAIQVPDSIDSENRFKDFVKSL